MEPLCTPKLRETTRHKPEGMAKNVPYRLPDTINVDGDVSFDEGDILQFLPGRQGPYKTTGDKYHHHHLTVCVFSVWCISLLLEKSQQKPVTLIK